MRRLSGRRLICWFPVKIFYKTFKSSRYWNAAGAFYERTVILFVYSALHGNSGLVNLIIHQHLYLIAPFQPLFIDRVADDPFIVFDEGADTDGRECVLRGGHEVAVVLPAIFQEDHDDLTIFKFTVKDTCVFI